MSVKNKELSPEEVMRRTTVLRRFRELLKAQRDRFGVYLNVLEKQKDVIERGAADSLIRHVELEEKIVADIFSIQKVINPLEELYRDTRRGTAASETTVSAVPNENNDIEELKSALEGLKTEAVSRSKRNRVLLSKRMAELRTEIKNLRTNPYVRPHTAFSDTGTPSLVDIRG